MMSRIDSSSLTELWWKAYEHGYGRAITGDNTIEARAIMARQLANSAVGSLTAAVEGEPPPSPLTPTETQVMQAVADGRAPKEIAANRGVMYETVISVLQRVRERLGAETTVAAAVVCVRNRWID
ncbi:MAG: LuxR C-terminal-related transcriptional regulator [Acidobacteria bacterium]|nr:LuxR C-terminal-related transcriptional regulator [Acidobacteriota bacterium]